MDAMKTQDTSYLYPENEPSSTTMNLVPTKSGLNEVEELVIVEVVPVVNPANYRHVNMPVTKELTRADVIARAKALGVRDYRDRVTLAIQNDEIQQSLGKLYSRDEVDQWIDAELSIDRYEDLHTISLAQARALAREGGLEDYSMAVLNAITRLEIDGVQYRGNQPRIPLEAFKEWLEVQGMPEDEPHDYGLSGVDLSMLDKGTREILGLQDMTPEEPLEDNPWWDFEMVFWPVVSVVGLIAVFSFLIANL